MIMRRTKDPERLFGLGALGKIKFLSMVSHRQSSSVSLLGGNWASKLLAVIGIRLYGATLKRNTSFRGMYQVCNVILHEREESATIALRKFRVQKNVKSGKGPLTPACLLKLVKRFEETGKLEYRARAGRPCLKEARAPCIAVEMEAIASEVASGTSRAREAARRLGLPPSSVRNILRRILQLYPYKLQSCHELLPADTAQREAFAKWAFSKMEQDPTWVFNILWTDEAHFSPRSIKYVGTERCDPQRSILHTSGRVALYRCWICHSPGMSSPLWWWWSCGVIKL
ncbi:uncharacterized protein TNCV_1629141 [Trichonephila clavipes]|uniref:DUF4817 domain-containing protein n=1 Tax=Trichonephila clavipes TaxID=2585209 RepID=A0A8X6WA52_TRICX|nr:uncharacterized protein TNCV_1629141 [Trichonephila clavipes]